MRIKWLLFFLLLFIFPIQSYANEFNFSVNTITPETQIDTSKTYFDILLPPNEEETLKIELANSTEKEVIVDVSINSAKTNSNGVVEYGQNKLKKDTSLVYDIEDYVNYPKEIKLKPKSTQIMEIHIKMPSERFDGLMAGGITFQEKINENEANVSKEGLSIKNEFSYVVALLMRQNINSISPNINLLEVKPDQINYRNVILATIQNDKRTYINDVVIKSQITKKENNKVLYQEEKSGIQIAPNSIFEFPTYLNGKALEAGDYKLSLQVFAEKDNNGQYTLTKDKEESYKYKWEYTKDFKIEKETAQKLNREDVTIEKDKTKTYIIIGIVLLIITLLLLVIIRRKNRNEKKNY